MNIFGYGGRPQGLWDKKTSNTFQDGSWADRDAAVAAARQELEAMNASGSIGISLTNTDTQNAAAVIQVQGAADQWGKLAEIVSGRPNSSGIAGGTVLGYDLETFGDTLHGARGQFGITEFGIGTTVFREGGLFSQRGHSLAIGLSSEQEQYVRGILNKYTTQGWTSLDNLEQVTMRRMSMYAGPDGADSDNPNFFRNVFGQVTEEGSFKGMWEVKQGSQLAPDMSPERIARGISNLSAVYKQGATSETVLPVAMQYLHDAHANGGILTGANTGYDIETLRRSAPGSFIDYLSTMRNDTVDLIYGVRAAADARTISVSTYQEMFHGTRGGGASVQALLSSLRYGENETHFSLSDINQQIQLLAARDFANGKSLGEDISQFFKASASGQSVMVNSSGKEIVKSYDSSSTLFLLNRGWLDKRKGADIALIDTGDGIAATQNYTITGEYWELDSVHTGEVEDGYRLSMKSTADGTIVSKRFETEAQALSFLRENSDWYDRGDISEDAIKYQAQYKYQDRGRRVFEKALDPASVAVDNGKAANGFAALEELLQWNEQYGNKYSATPEGFHAFVADMNNSGGIKAGVLNKMQEFLGAQEKVADESTLLRMIVDQVNSQFGDEFGTTSVSNNMQKTIMARRAYEDAMATLSSQGMLQHSDAHQNLIMSDIFGVDIQMPDGGISRINAHTVSTATRDVNRIFGRMTKQEAQSTIDKLVARQVIDSQQGDRFKALLQEVGVESGRDAAKKMAIEKYLGTDSSYQLYTDIGYALSSRANMPSNAAAFTLADAATGTSGSFSARMQGYIHRRFETPDGTQSINGLLGSNSDIAAQISAGISKSVTGVPVIAMHDSAQEGSVMTFKKELGALAESLGYGTSILTPATRANGEKYYRNIVEEMFFIKPINSTKNYGAAERDGVHSVVVRPDENGSAFVLLTNNDNYGRLMDELSMTHAKDIATYKSITGSGLAQYATIYELPKVQRYNVGAHSTDAIKEFMGADSAELIALKQSENAEKFLITRLNVDKHKYGSGDKQKVYAYVNNGIYDYLSSWRMRGALALDKIENGQFQDATRYLRQQQSRALEDLSSSASYRGLWVTDPVTGKQSILRRPNYTPADYMYARRMRMTEGLHDMFTFALSNDEGDQRNSLDVLVDAYGEAFGVYRNRKQSTQAYRKKVAGSTYFKEFFNKNLFLGDMSDDAIVGGIYGVRDRNIFSLLQETIERDTSDLFDESVKKVLNSIKPMAEEGSIYQVLSGTAMQHGDVSLGVAAGEYNVNAFLYDTMRPTYLQQNLGRMFDPLKEWNASVFKDDFLLTVAGSPEITLREYDARTLSKFADGYENQVRHVMTGFKQMSDHNLQRKYAFMQENAATLASQVGLSKEAYEKALGYVREDMMSLHEGKWFIDPRLAEQQIVREADAKKVKLLDIKRADAQRSGEVLQALVDENAIITANTIVGYDSAGRTMFAGDNLRTCIDVFNLEDIFDIQDGFDEQGKSKKFYSFKNGATGYTRVIPQSPDIVDTKFMFNGAEKATGHAINIDAFLTYMQKDGIASREQALDVLSTMFHQISDGATVIGHMNLEKHGNLMAVDSPWRIMTTEYVASGKGQLLVNLLNARVKNADKDTAYAGIGKFDFVNGEIVSDTSHVTNPAKFLRAAINDILNDWQGDAATNARIRDIIAYTKEHGITYGALEFMNQNEHVSDGISLDKRIEQGIRQRAYALRNGEHWDQQWADELSSFTGKRTNSKSQYDKLNQIFSFWDEHVGFNRMERQNKRINMEKSLHGIVESLVYYEDPNAFNVASQNILQVDFQDLIGTGVIPKNGAGVSDLEGSLFFTDGKPSEALKKLAGENVDFGTLHSSYSNSIYVNLGSYSILGKDGKTEMHGFLMPIQNIITDADETMFQNQQRRTAKMLSDIQKEIQNPGKRSTAKINAKLSDIMREYYRDSMKQLAVADKDSDYYKAIQRHFMGNSGGMLAEQEVAPMVYDDKSNARLMALLDERDAISSRIANRAYGTDASLDDISRLDGISAEIKEINKTTAERIRNGDVLDFTQLKGTSLEGLTKEIVNGKTVYGYVAATSRQAFEDHGLHFGKFGMDIMSDIELKGGLVPQDFVEHTALGYRQTIMDNINAANIDGLTIKSKHTMMQEINDWAKQFNIKDLNEAIAEKGAVSQVASMFDTVAERYMKEVGIVGELVRYPTFRSQFASRFVLSDHVTSNQVVMFNPAASSITNADFDGDLMYSIFKFNGSSGLLDRNAAMIQRQAYETGLIAVPELLAQLVEDGGAYKFTDPNSEAILMASILKKMDRPSYDTLRKAYAASHGFNADDMTTGQELAFHSSQDVRDAFLNMEYNTIFDLRSQKASIAPVLRKDNIGYVSTTNFNARTMIQDMIDTYGRMGDTKSYDQAVSILNALTNPTSKSGGFLDITEQLAIDTKHVWDAMSTAETARYSTGMHLLFGKYAMPREGVSLETQQRVAVEHIVSSMYNSVFVDTNKGLEANKREKILAIVDEIMHHKGDWMDYKFVGDAAAKRGIAALLALQELDLPNDLANLRKIFTSSFNKGYDAAFDDNVYSMEEVSELMEMYRNATSVNAQIDPQYRNSQTYFRGLAEFIQQSISDRSLQTTSKISHAMPATLQGAEDLVVTLNHGRYTDSQAIAVFDVYRMDKASNRLIQVDAKDYVGAMPSAMGMKVQDGSLRFAGRDNKALNQVLFGDKGFLTGTTQLRGASAINNNANVARDAFAAVGQAKVAKGINSLVMAPSGGVASHAEILRGVQAMQAMSPEAQAKFGQSEYNTISQLFSGPGVNASNVSRRTAELARTYEYARSSRQIHTQVPINSLLTSINEDIAAHPERYKDKSGGAVHTFDQILERRMLDDQIFSSPERIESMRQEMLQLGDFDINAYSTAVQDLRNSIYDVQQESEALSKRYKQFFASNPYGQTKAAQEAQATVTETIGQFSAELSAANQKSIDAAQTKIYSMFKDRDQMVSFFGWNGRAAAGLQKVGFGMHIGQTFGTLTHTEAELIIASASEIIDNKALPDDVRFAAEQTANNLGSYMRDIGVANARSNIQFSKETSKILENSMKKVDKLQEDAKIEVSAKQAADEMLKKSGIGDAATSAGGKTARQTLSGHLWGKAKDFVQAKGITGKHVGVVAAGLAALGIANNLLHNQKTDSPLAPAHKPNGKGSPSIEGYYPDAPAESAPPTAGTGRKTVYHSNGLNFRVSASTSRTHNARQQAAQMSSITGGSTNVSIQQDTSQVTDNWLANKFADLI